MTAEQRRQVIDFGKIRGTGMPIPAGMSSPSARAHILNLYYEVPAVIPTVYFWRNKNLIGGSWFSKKIPSTSWRSKSSPATPWVKPNTPQDGTTQEI